MIKKILPIIILTGCLQTTKPPDEPQKLPEDNELPQLSWNNDAWTLIALESLDKYGQGLLKSTPKDATKFCANYSTMNKAQFWASLLSAMSKYESNYKPNTQYKEAFKDAKGNYVISRGLLQISQESANGYKCGITKAEMLHDVRTNLECGVRILNRWVTNDSVITGNNGRWIGGARYWSVLRKDNTLNGIKKLVKCQN